MMIIDIYYEIYENCLVLINYVRVAWPASQWVRKRTYMCTVRLLADKIRSRRAREKTFHLWKRLSHIFRLLIQLREHARVPAGQSRVVLISIRRLSILCLISTTLVRIGTKCLPVWFYYYEAHSNVRMETMKMLCVPVQGCEDVEEEFDVNVGACRWVGSNHENKIGLKRGIPSSGGNLFVPKSKPIAKSLPRCHVTRWEFLGSGFRSAG